MGESEEPDFLRRPLAEIGRRCAVLGTANSPVEWCR
jgi:hypothetical protein